jgi:hypothetical protein
LAVSVTTNKQRYTAVDSVEATGVVRNVSGRACEAPDSVGFSVYDSAGTMVQGGGQVDSRPAGASEQRLEPGQQRAYVVTWNQQRCDGAGSPPACRRQPGDYVIKVSWAPELSASASITLV